ncbi:MAG: hypothetical protein GY870_19620 [archaeon]|nr:hypothetical protein [archaeon]
MSTEKNTLKINESMKEDEDDLLMDKLMKKNENSHKCGEWNPKSGKIN